MIKLPRLECLRCGYVWVPRTPEVRVCPKCHSVYWNRNRREKNGRLERKRKA